MSDARPSVRAVALVLGIVLVAACQPSTAPAAPAQAPAQRSAPRIAVSDSASTRAAPLTSPAALGRSTQPAPAVTGDARGLGAGQMAAQALAGPPPARASRPASSPSTPGAPGTPTAPGTGGSSASAARTTRTIAARRSASGTPSASATPAADDGVYPTPTLRPAHAPPRGPFIIPRPMPANVTDHAVSAAGFYREDSVTPVPFRRDPAPPPGGDGAGGPAASVSPDGSP